jgi:hypothetical protein
MNKCRLNLVVSGLTISAASTATTRLPFSFFKDRFAFWRKPERKAVRLVAFAFAVSLVCFNLPTTAWAADVFHGDGNSAIAQFASFDPAGCDCNVDSSCVFTSVFVFAADSNSFNLPGPGSSSSFADMFIFKSDCTGLLMNAGCFPSGPLADEDWQVSGNKNSATLKTRLECLESVSGNPFAADVDLKWEGTGPLARSNTHSHTSYPGCMINNHASGSIRPTMEFGTVSDGITNFTPDPSEPGNGDNIASGKNGQTLFGCQ